MLPTDEAMDAVRPPGVAGNGMILRSQVLQAIGRDTPSTSAQAATVPHRGNLCSGCSLAIP